MKWSSLVFAFALLISLSFAAASLPPATVSPNLQVAQLLPDTYHYNVNKTITGAALQIDAFGGNKVIVYSSSNGTNETTRLLAVLNSATKDYLFLYKKAGYDYYTSTTSFYIQDTSQFNIVKLYSDTYLYDGNNYLSGVSLKITATSSAYAIKAAMVNSTQYYSDNMLSVIDNSTAAFHHLFKIPGNNYYTTAANYTLVVKPANTTNKTVVKATAVSYNYTNYTNKTVARPAAIAFNYTNTTNKTSATVAKVVTTTTTATTTKPTMLPSAPGAKPAATTGTGTTPAATTTTETKPVVATTATGETKPAPTATTTSKTTEADKTASDVVNSMADTSGDMYAKLMNILGIYVQGAK